MFTAKDPFSGNQYTYKYVRVIQAYMYYIRSKTRFLVFFLFYLFLHSRMPVLYTHTHTPRIRPPASKFLRIRCHVETPKYVCYHCTGNVVVHTWVTHETHHIYTHTTFRRPKRLLHFCTRIPRCST